MTPYCTWTGKKTESVVVGKKTAQNSSYELGCQRQIKCLGTVLTYHGKCDTEIRCHIEIASVLSWYVIPISYMGVNDGQFPNRLREYLRQQTEGWSEYHKMNI